MSGVLDRLKEGAQKFYTDIHSQRAAEYQKAATTPQQPHTLVIACSDSRVDVENITSAGPGEVFINRNVGNMVPAYGEMLGGVSAVVEYAVTALKVKHVMICGHSDCGAMKALLNPGSADAMPAVKSWLGNGHESLEAADGLGQADDTAAQRLRRLTEQNVLMQMAHLKTHPSVAGALARNALTISGWVYEIGTGEVRIVEDGQQEFVTVPTGTGEPASAVGATA